jgi:peptidoglycan/xylan/chitin deacetylase (PgdA/CDA1 family)
MPLPDEHLLYPRRRHGQDIDRHDWRLSVDRPPIAWPKGAGVAAMIVVPIEFFMLNPSGKPFKHPGAMVTPYPDLRHYTTRDYGNRVGVHRILKALEQAGLKAVFPINACLLEPLAPLVARIAAGGHEIAAHGWDTDTLHWGGMDPVHEAETIARVRHAFSNAGHTPRTWMSPARNQSERTPDLIHAAGFQVCLDWETDGVPWPMRTQSGAIWGVPLLNELDDRKLLIDQRQTETEWRDQILAARDLLAAEAPRFGGQVLSFTLTPYVTGLPFRIRALREVLSALSSDPGVWNATAGEIADHVAA